MHWTWKLLIVVSLGMNLVGYGAQVVIVDKALSEFGAQLGALHGVSSDQQKLHREVIELRSICATKQML